MPAGNSIKIEVCVDSIESGLNAQKGGADRLEVCQGLVEGGTTPSAGFLRVLRRLVDLPLHVMIRPRAGDFCYSDKEFEVMREDIETARECGAHGIVLGLLRQTGEVDRPRTAQLIELAKGMSITFHRAFDMSVDPSVALEDLVELGVSRVLTSGQEKSAWEGIELITRLVRQAGDRIHILPGGGITEQNVHEILQRSGAREFHVSASAAVESPMVFRNTRCSMGRQFGGPEYSYFSADAGRIQAFRQAACDKHGD
jgi:copper homeostasis protein